MTLDIFEETLEQFEDMLSLVEIQTGESERDSLRQTLTTIYQRGREDEREAKWEELNRYTIKERDPGMTDWIDWDDVCRVFGKETDLDERIRQKREELEELEAKRNSK